MVRWENGKRVPDWQLGRPAELVSKGRKHHLKSINCCAGEKHTSAIPHSVCFYFAESELLTKRNLIALGIVISYHLTVLSGTWLG